LSHQRIGKSILNYLVMILANSCCRTEKTHKNLNSVQRDEFNVLGRDFETVVGQVTINLYFTCSKV